MNKIPRFVYVNPIIFLLFFYSWAIGYTVELIILYGTIILHELAHILAAKYFNIKVKKVLITPIGIVAQMDDEGYKRGAKEIIIALAGPISNLIMACGGYIANSYFLDNSKLMSFFILSNFSLLILNILPVMPLDGGRVFKYILLSNLGYRKTIKTFSIVSKSFAIFLIIVGFFQVYNYAYNLSILFIGIFLYVCMHKEKEQMQFSLIKELIDKDGYKGTLEPKYLTKHQEKKVIDVIGDFYSNKFNIVKVADNDKNIKGELTQVQLLECLTDCRVDITLEEALDYYKSLK